MSEKMFSHKFPPPRCEKCGANLPRQADMESDDEQAIMTKEGGWQHTYSGHNWHRECRSCGHWNTTTLDLTTTQPE